MDSGAALSKHDLFFLASLFLLESSITVMAMAMYMQGERPFVAFLSSRPGMAFLCALAAFFIAGWGIVYRYLAHNRSPSRHFRFIVMMNLVTVLLIVITSELIVRVGSRSEGDREMFGKVTLKPRNWERTQLHYSQFFEKSRADLSLLVYDDRLGWTVGRNRYHADKMEKPFWSSSDGLRAPHEGVAFPKIEGKTEIALVGDSFTFGDEVTYEETWGYQLQQMLGEDIQVLNFGVPGYGIDQAYLRYEKDVRWRSPAVVILGFITDDLSRTMWVYPFLSSSWKIPFSAPRFVLRDEELTNINMHPLPPEAIFSKGSISELPFLEYDRGYRPSDWQKRWYHVSYLVRLVTSLFPNWLATIPDTSDATRLSVNAAILKTLMQSAKQAGSIPHVIFFPGRRDLTEPTAYPSLVKHVLEQAGVAYIDPTPCLLEVNPADRFLEGHYSPQGNAAVAKCVYKAVKESLAQLSVPANRGGAHVGFVRDHPSM